MGSQKLLMVQKKTTPVLALVLLRHLEHGMTIRMSESVFILLATTTLDKLQILTKGATGSKGPYITFQHSSPLGSDKKFLPRF